MSATRKTIRDFATPGFTGVRPGGKTETTPDGIVIPASPADEISLPEWHAEMDAREARYAAAGGTRA